MSDKLLVVDEVYVDCVEDEVLLIKKIEVLLENIKKKRERIVILVCDQERTVLRGKK